MSSLISEEEIGRFEALASTCYTRRIISRSGGTAEMAAVMALTWIGLCRSNTFATRAGGKEKMTPQLSSRSEVSRFDIEEADRHLRELQKLQGAKQGTIESLVDDVFGIYFNSSYTNIKLKR